MRDKFFSFDGFELKFSEKDKMKYPFNEHAKKILQHYFDILGSGETKVFYGMSCKGFLGYSYNNTTHPSNKNELIMKLNSGNRDKASKIRNLISKNYIPIDWHLDFKSGFRWKEDIPSNLITYGNKLGVDIKVPWELARLNHLPELAIAYFLSTSSSTKSGFSNRCKTEFIDQTLDFISANPPGWGVNWACSMDVAIRAINLVVAYEIFSQKGPGFDETFNREFISVLISHGRHIENNLEWEQSFRGNHYLANILGLIILGSVLCGYKKADLWLAFGIHELMVETKNQFLPDGANFEASSNYHRLSSEIVTIGTAVVAGLSDERRTAVLRASPSEWNFIPSLKTSPSALSIDPTLISYDHYLALFKMAHFSRKITKPNGDVVQIGDNDSGRILKLFSKYDSDLSHNNLIAMIYKLVDNSKSRETLEINYCFEADLVESIAKGRTYSISHSPRPNPHFSLRNWSKNMVPTSQINIEFEKPIINSHIETIKFDNFGIYIWKSSRFFLSVRCGAIGQNGRGGHAHNDQLAIELQIDGKDWIADPGSFIYTPDPALRDLYRSAFAHSGPRIGSKEPSNLNLGMFRLENNAKSRCLKFNRNTFVGVSRGNSDLIYRKIVLKTKSLQIHDGIISPYTHRTNISIKTAKSPESLRTIFNLSLPFSSHYGEQG